MKRLVIVIFIVIGFGLVLGDGPLVYAQETDEFTLEEVLVTAQKREENLQKVSITMDTISGNELTEMGYVDLDGALQKISTVFLRKNNYGVHVSIRGMGNDLPPIGNISMVGINVDGSFTGRTETGQTGLYDIQRIEVLAGPQGTLYSRNSSGGVVNIISADPTDQYEGSGSIEAGNYELLNLQGMINAPVGETAALRVAFASASREGYLSNGLDDNDAKSARMKLKYTPNDNLSVIFGAEYTKTGGKGTGGLGADAFIVEPAEPWTSSFPNDVWVKRFSHRYYINANWDLGFGELTFLPAYSARDLNDRMYFADPGGLRDVTSFQNEDETNIELRLVSPSDSKTKWLIGLYHYYRDLITGFDNYPRGSGLYSERGAKDPSYAAFGNTTYPINDKLRINAGLRYTLDKQKTFSYSETVGAVPVGTYSEEVKESRHFDYKLGFEYDISQNSMLWADWSTGFRQGYSNQKDQTVDTYQLGSKNRFLNERLQINATAFYNDYVGYAVMDSKTYTLNGVIYMDRGSGNADQAVTYGLDLQTNLMITRKDRLDISVSYMNTEITNLVIYYEDYYAPYTGYEGMQLTNSPEYAITFSYEHEFTLNNGGSITPRVDSRYETESRLSFLDTTRFSVEPDHHISNCSLKYGAPDGKWSINFYLKNIENHPEKIGYPPFGASFVSLGAPRTYGAVLSMQF